MIETRLVAKKLSLKSRLRRSATLEGGLIAGLVMLWTLIGFAAFPIVLLWIVLVASAAALLFLALDSSVAGMQTVFAVLMLVVTAGIAADVFSAPSLPIGLVGAASTSYLTMELFRLHDLRRLGSLVNERLLAGTLPWSVAIVVVSLCLSWSSSAGRPTLLQLRGF
ncbi:MAG: hypothetical protein R2706_06650 [Acidimicrobiales bacterium]